MGNDDLSARKRSFGAAAWQHRPANLFAGVRAMTIESRARLPLREVRCAQPLRPQVRHQHLPRHQKRRKPRTCNRSTTVATGDTTHVTERNIRRRSLWLRASRRILRVGPRPHTHAMPSVLQIGS